MSNAERSQVKARKRQLKCTFKRHGKFITEATYNPNEDIDISLALTIKEYESTYSQLAATFGNLYLYVKEDDDTTFDVLVKEQDEAFQEYIRVKTTINTLSPPSTTSTIKNQPSSSVTPVPVKLPQLDLPKFGGAVDEWFYFEDLFKSLIDDNAAIHDIQRFQYLKASLFSEAAETISELPTTAANYKVAWDLLKVRFQNKGQIIGKHLNEIIDLPHVMLDDANSLTLHCNQFNKNIRALKQLNELNVDNILIHLSMSKLDDSTKERWAEYCQNSSKNEVKVTADELIHFLTARTNVLRSKGYITSSKSQSKQGVISFRKSVNTNQSRPANNTNMCSICNQDHRIYTCRQFTNASIERRWQLVKDNKLCSNCLGKGHNRDSCSSRIRCMKCKAKHHSFLHRASHIQTTQQATSNGAASAFNSRPTPAVPASSPVTSTAACTAPTGTGLVTNTRVKGFVFMPTAIIDIRDNNGIFHPCRAIIDSASDVNIITDSLANRLRLNRHQQSLHLEGLGSSRTNVSAEVTTIIRSQHQNYLRELDFLVLSKITSEKPSVTIQTESFEIPANIKLADPRFNESSAIDVLLSAEIIHELTESGVIQVNKFGASAVNTKLGWTVSGKCAIMPNHYNVLYVSNKDLDNHLKRFWEIETVPYKLKPRESASEVHFKTTTRRDVDGRFIVSLPFNNKLHELGSTYELANKQFLALERRFQRNSTLYEQYSSNLQDYIDRGHMTVCDNDNITEGYYLPHHAVFKATSITTKCRVVFNASAKSTTGVSLNDTLYVGPVIQDNLHNILIRFRKHAIVLTSDIERMYRQIQMTPEHRSYQKIRWRSSPNSDLKTYMLNTVTFGEASAPFTATRCLNELADLVRNDLPNVARVILNDFYVDDCLTGCDTLSEAHQLKRDLITVLSSGQFNLTKWRSNLPEFSDESADSTINLSNAHMNTLGLMWNYRSDMLHFHLNFNELSSGHTTKRAISSDACKLFDPLGLVAPIIITAKVILQELWKLKLDWDEPVPNDIEKKWNMYKTSLHDVHLINTPRCVFSESLTIQTELHGFCDASLKAYGAALYIRTINSDNIVTTRLLCSKTRVSPTKQISLPRLELSGAVLLAEVIESTIDAIQTPFKRVFLWTDSTIVLQWINNQSSDFKTFVGNRVGRIQDLTAKHQWRHVPTSDNPADLLSRGVPCVDLLANNLWWHGPSFLSRDDVYWPATDFPLNDQLPEQRSHPATTLVTCEPLQLSARHSSLNKLKRVMAYMKRFIENSRNINRRTGELTVDELEGAMTSLIFMEQQIHFKDDLKFIARKGTVAPASRLSNLMPFMDENSILRVGGRLQHAAISLNQKFPIILPSHNHLTKLIIIHTHLSLLHAGMQATLSTLRLQYWPIGGKSIVRQVVRNCVRCCRAKPKLQQHVMGPLPASRVQPGRAFATAGVDYAGPFHLISSHRRGAKCSKAYMCIFVCFTTKAVHLELVGDLTSESCLGAIKRFIARRGIVNHLYSDNATNFVGCNRELLAISAAFNNTSVQTQATLLGIKWSFIPPRSPHFGGLWEAAVKSAKHHLRRIAGQASLTYEEMATLLTQIEACLNSRPITPLSDDVNDLNALTPGHFLIGQPLTAPAEHDLMDVRENRLSKWQRIQRLQQHFWKRWQQEYLSQLQVRAKWTKQHPSLKGGELVTIRDSNSPPLQWRLGRVLEVHTGSDNVVRVATIKTADSVIKTSVSRLCVIPTSEV